MRAAHLLAALVSALLIAPLPAAAQNATWLGNPATNDFNTAANWSPATVPTGTANFGASNTTSLTLSSDITLGGWTFSSSAPNYTFTSAINLGFTGAGIVTGGSTVTINNSGAIVFINASAAGSSTIINSNTLGFFNSANAGTANISNSGFITFDDNSSAGSATIVSGGLTGNLQFLNNATAGAATITTNNGGSVFFADQSSGGTSRQIVNAGGLFDISFVTPIGFTIGSLEGAGTVRLGGNTLIVGGNNLSTSFSGTIQDGGTNGGTGSSLVKTGTGGLTLSGVNTYTGGTTLNGGTLSVSSESNLGDLGGALTFNGGILQITGTTFNSTVRNINWGALGGGFDIADAANEFQLLQTLSGTGGLTKLGAGTLTVFGFNDYSGATIVSAGTLKAGVSGALSFNSVHTIAAGAAIDLFGSIQFIAGLSGAGNVINTSPDSARLIIGTPGVGDITGTFSGSIRDGSGNPTTVWVSGPGVFTVTGDNTYTGGTAICFCSTLQIGDGGTTGSILGDVTNGGTLIFNRSNSYTFGGVISDDFTDRGKVVQQGSGTTVLTGANTYSGGTFFNNGTLSVSSENNLGDLGGALTFNGGILQITGTSFTSTTRIINWGANGGGFDIADAANTFFLPRALTGTGGLIKAGAGTLVLQSANTYTGATTVSGGTLKAGIAGAFSSASAYTVSAGATLDLAGTNETIGSLAGAGNVTNSNSGLPVRLTTGGDGSSTLFSGVINGATALTKVGAGTLTLTGTDTYTGDTLVSSGKLVVNGSIASSSSLTVASGATIGGSGQLPSTTVSGTISPGNSPGTITVNGTLVLNPGSTYLAEVQGAVADRITVTGTASIAGTLNLTPLGGVYTFNTPYTLLSAAGGVSGTFGTVTTSGSFGAAIAQTVSYNANSVLLTLTPTPLANVPTLGVNRPTNPLHVAQGIDRAVAAGANPQSFVNLYSQSAAALPGAVNTLSGEVHTAGNAIGVEVSDQFLRAMLDPAAIGRPGAQAAGPYTIWGAALGRRGRTNGDPTGTGSATRTVESAAFAAGADYRITPDSIIGFALAGGGANASLANGMGSADAGIFEAGVYGQTRFGDLQLGASGAYTFLDVDTKRTAPVLRPGNITAGYRMNGFSGRLEASYRVATLSDIAISPFAAFQVQNFATPGFVEDGGSSGALGTLTSSRQNNLTTRSELGVKLETKTQIAGYGVSGFVRAAWAQYFNREMAFAASINGLPGSNFVIDGAKPDHAALRLATGFDVALRENMTLGARFDSDLAKNSTAYAGSVRFQIKF